MLIDTHAHLDYPAFQEDFAEVLRRAHDAGVTRIISIATGLESSRRVVALAEAYPQIFAVVGIHPNHAHEEVGGAIEEIERLAAHPKVVGIGEIGLDFFRLPGSENGEATEVGMSIEALAQQRSEIIASQHQTFRALLEVAIRCRKNVVIHQRSSWEETMAYLREYAGRLQAVVHCFGGTSQEAQEVLSLGHLVSFTGIATFKNGGNMREAAASLPAGSFMVETDCPYLAPVPFRGKRCEPAHVLPIATVLAAARSESLEALAGHTTRSAESFFQLPPR